MSVHQDIEPQSWPVLDVDELSVHFPGDRRANALTGEVGTRAVDGVSFSIRPGETLGLVGESGAGKSTVARAVLGLRKPTSGAIRVFDIDIGRMTRTEHRYVRRHMQAVFQDPYASLNPFKTIRAIVNQPLKVHGMGDRAAREARAVELLRLVGLQPEFMDRHPRDFSGGQRQRIAIARALAPDPRFLVLDEPLSSLDVSIQAQIVNLLLDLKEQLGLTYLFIAHDLSVVRLMADQVIVMYAGQVMERAPVDSLFAQPLHPYSIALLSSVPIPDPKQSRRFGAVASQEQPATSSASSGCRFRNRCPFARADCAEQPTLSEAAEGHFVACHFWQEVSSSAPAKRVAPSHGL
jgi:oligopeptide transport system ATP-binding protein